MYCSRTVYPVIVIRPLAHYHFGGHYEYIKEAFKHVYQLTFPEQTDVADRYLQLLEQQKHTSAGRRKSITSGRDLARRALFFIHSTQ